jgi:protein tyrosine phosphatase (PTP) superfamily phosphohydrolase (DUF442 family)
MFLGAEAQPDGTIASIDTAVVPALAGPSAARATRGVPWRMLAVMVAATLLVGNLGLLGLTVAARTIVGHPTVASIEGVGALRRVDDKVLRGANPTHQGYEGLRDAGVTTVVDLRAEPGAHADDELIRSLGMEVVHLPIRDGQTPSDEQQAAFLDLVRDAPGQVFLHCGAGVGRTGVVAARYLVETDQRQPMGALARNLEVGPPSLEQNAYSLGIDLGPAHPALVAVSRFFDAPRRILHYL